MSYYDMLLAKKLAGGSATLQEKSVSITQNGDSTILPDEGYDGMSKVDVSVNVSGGGEAPENDVEFIDYDGTIVYSYTAQEFLALTEMPANPTHEGLTAQGWNWSLADAKEYVTDYGGLVIGQMYITDDGKTRIYYKVYDGASNNARLPIVRISKSSGSGGYSVDFNDGNPAQHFTASNTNIRPISPLSAGEHRIDISVDPDTKIILSSVGYETSGNGLFTAYNNSTAITEGSQSSQSTNTSYVHIGDNAKSGSWGLSNYVSLKGVSAPIGSIKKPCNSFCRRNDGIQGFVFPSDATEVSELFFSSSPTLLRVSFPKSVTFSGTGCFSSCWSLKKVHIPETVSSIPGSFCERCVGLTKITIPSTVTTIESHAFAYCYSMGEIKFTSSVPPTLSSSYAFQNLPTDCVIYVPYSEDHSVLNAYKTATNYPNPSTYTYVEY